jgi:voltage-gated potassium channel
LQQRSTPSLNSSTSSLVLAGSTASDSNTGSVWEQDASGRVRTPLEPLVLAATLLLIPVLILDRDTSGTWHVVGNIGNWVIWAVFALEIAAILYAAPRKKAALRAHWLDVALVLVTFPLLGRVLSGLRLLRLTRLLRVVRVATVVGRALQAERSLTSTQTFRVVGLITLFIVVVAGAAQAEFNADEVSSLWDGLWWAVVTVTTVGYGDIPVTSVPGRIIALIVMLIGIGFLSVLTATFASRFVKQDSHSDQLLAAMKRIEAELAEIKITLAEPARGSRR